ncbi:MAG: hypothetical protein AAF823_08670 [Planctomycetota bacterium]
MRRFDEEKADRVLFAIGGLLLAAFFAAMGIGILTSERTEPGIARGALGTTAVVSPAMQYAGGVVCMGIAAGAVWFVVQNLRGNRWVQSHVPSRLRRALLREEFGEPDRESTHS